MAELPHKMQSPNGRSVPDPDPTDRTIEQLLREIATAREIVESKAIGGREVIETRLRGMDTAIELLQEASDKIPQFIKDQVSDLQSLHTEKISGANSVLTEKIKSLSDVTTQMFKSIDDRFAEKDKAVSVGLQAQKESAAAQQASNTEATVKMESNFTKLLDQGRELLTEVRRNTELQINDIKSRLDKGEGKSSVSDPATLDALQKMTNAVSGLKEMNAHAGGRSKGAGDLMGWIFGAAGFASAVVVVVGTLLK